MIIFLWCCGCKRQANKLRIFSVPFWGKRERICLCPICVKPKLFIVQHPFNLPSFHLFTFPIFPPFHLFIFKGRSHFFTLSPFHLSLLFTLKGRSHFFTFSPFHPFTLKGRSHFFTFSPFHFFTLPPFHL